MYRATVRRLGGAQTWSRSFETADVAARQLFVLLRAGGWDGTEDDAVTALLTGDPLVSKGFEYQVSEERAD
jgi:hypothetical protein